VAINQLKFSTALFKMSTVNYIVQFQQGFWDVFSFRGFRRFLFRVREYLLAPGGDTVDDLRNYLVNLYNEAIGNMTQRRFTDNLDSFTWGVSFSNELSGEKIYTGFSIGRGDLGFNDSVDYFIQLLEEVLQRYRYKDFLGFVTILATRPRANIVHGGQLQSRFKKGHKEFYIIDYRTSKNCLFTGFWIGHLFATKKMININTYKIGPNVSKFKTKVLKKYPNLKECEVNSVNMEIFQRYFVEKKSNFTNYRITILGPQFNVLDIYEPQLKDARCLQLYFRAVQNHFQLLLPKSSIKDPDQLKSLAVYCKDMKIITHIGEEPVYVDVMNNYYFEGSSYNFNEYQKLLFDHHKISDSARDQVYIKPKPPSEAPLLEFFTFDLESTGDSETFIQESYLNGMAFISNNQLEFVNWSGRDCINQMFNYLDLNISFFANKIGFAHNGAKFDYFLVLKEYLLKNTSIFEVEKDILIVDGGIILFSVKHLKTKKIIKFKDSCRLLPGSLSSLCDSFKPPVEKMKNFDIVAAGKNWETNLDEIKKYHKNDCLSLYYILDSFQKLIRRVSEISGRGQGVDALSCVTTSQLSMQIYLEKFYDRGLYKMPYLMDIMLRKFYFGGMVGCHMLGKFNSNQKNQIFMEDFNSLYPTVMTFPLPSGKYTLFDRTELLEKLWIGILESGFDRLIEGDGFIICKVHTKPQDFGFFEKYGGLHGYHNGLNLLFPIFDEPTLTIIYSREIYYCQENNVPYNYEILGMVSYVHYPICKEFVNVFYAMKQEGTLRDEVALVVILKLLQNGLYGKFALKLLKDVVKLRKGREMYESINSWQKGCLLDVNEVGDYLFTKERQIINPNVAQVGIGAAITSLARIMLYSCKLELTTYADILFYDTDSLCFVLKVPFEEFAQSPFYEKYCKGGKEEELGKLKDEMSLKKTQKAFSPKFDEFLKERNLDPKYALIPIDRAYVAGCKMYGLETTHNSIIDGQVVTFKRSKYALKGCSDKNMNMDKIGVILDGTYEYKQKEFKSGLPSLFDSKNPCSVRVIPEEAKKPKKFKSIYLKGELEEIDYAGVKVKLVKPLKISQVEKQKDTLDILGIFKHMKE
jgi:hypothetical protein